MIRRTMPLLVVLGSILILSACDGSADDQKSSAEGGKKVVYLGKESIPKDPAEQYYQQVCMSCHATGVGPEIRGRELPPDAVKMFVRNGSRGMPAFPESMIDDATLDGVANLVSTSTTPPAVQYPYAQ